MEIKENSHIVGKGGVYDDIAAVFDDSTFVELGTYVKKDSYASVVCGYGAVNGALTFAFAQDFTRDKGALGEAEAEKICALYDLAKKSGAPVIGIWNSAGARVGEGERVLSAFGKMLSKITALSGVVPQIAVVNGICGGMSATAVSMFDVIVATEGSSFYVNPPFVLKNLGLKNAGSIALAAKNGLVDIVCPDSAGALAKARELVALLPQNNAQGFAYCDSGDDDNRRTPEIVGCEDTLSLIAAIADGGRFIPLKSDFAAEMLTGFAPIGGVVTGIVATGHGRTLTPKGARKASGFISFCDNFMIPVVTLVDTDGIDISADAENAAYAPELARLAAAYSASTNTKVTAIVGKAYGAAYTLLGSKAVGADVVLATENAEISVMAPDAAVQFMYGNEIKTPGERAEKKNEWMKDHACAVAAASTGDIDDVIAPEELRARLISAVGMLWAKASGEASAKHSKLPF